MSKLFQCGVRVPYQNLNSTHPFFGGIGIMPGPTNTILMTSPERVLNVYLDSFDRIW